MCRREIINFFFSSSFVIVSFWLNVVYREVIIFLSYGFFIFGRRFYDQVQYTFMVIFFWYEKNESGNFVGQFFLGIVGW